MTVSKKTAGAGRWGELDRMAETSGKVTDDRPLVLFLYLLLRDHVAFGAVEGIADEATGADLSAVFSNGWAARHAQDLADRLIRV